MSNNTYLHKIEKQFDSLESYDDCYEYKSLDDFFTRIENFSPIKYSIRINNDIELESFDSADFESDEEKYNISQRNFFKDRNKTYSSSLNIGDIVRVDKKILLLKSYRGYDYYTFLELNSNKEYDFDISKKKYDLLFSRKMKEEIINFDITKLDNIYYESDFEDFESDEEISNKLISFEEKIFKNENLFKVDENIVNLDFNLKFPKIVIHDNDYLNNKLEVILEEDENQEDENQEEKEQKEEEQKEEEQKKNEVDLNNVNSEDKTQEEKNSENESNNSYCILM